MLPGCTHGENEMLPLSLGTGRDNDRSVLLSGHGENQCELMPIKYYNYSMESSDGAMRNWASGSNLLRAENSREKRQPQFFFSFVPTTSQCRAVFLNRG